MDEELIIDESFVKKHQNIRATAASVLLLWASTDIPRRWCSASPCLPVYVVLPCHEFGYVLSSLARSLCGSWASRNTYNPRGHARSSRWQRWQFYTFASRCLDAPATVDGSTCIGTHGQTDSAAPRFPAWCPWCGWMPCSGCAVLLSVCP